MKICSISLCANHQNSPCSKSLKMINKLKSYCLFKSDFWLHKCSSSSTLFSSVFKSIGGFENIFSILSQMISNHSLNSKYLDLDLRIISFAESAATQHKKSLRPATGTLNCASTFVAVKVEQAAIPLTAISKRVVKYSICCFNSLLSADRYQSVEFSRKSPNHVLLFSKIILLHRKLYKLKKETENLFYIGTCCQVNFRTCGVNFSKRL